MPRYFNSLQDYLYQLQYNFITDIVLNLPETNYLELNDLVVKNPVDIDKLEHEINQTLFSEDIDLYKIINTFNFLTTNHIIEKVIFPICLVNDIYNVSSVLNELQNLMMKNKIIKEIKLEMFFLHNRVNRILTISARDGFILVHQQNSDNYLYFDEFISYPYYQTGYALAYNRTGNQQLPCPVTLLPNEQQIPQPVLFLSDSKKRNFAVANDDSSISEEYHKRYKRL